MTSQGPVEVYVGRNASDAAAALAMLRAEGIEGRIVGENLQTAAGDLGISYNALPRIWVVAEHAARARELIARHEEEARERDSEPAGDPWTCPKCGETVEADFDLCWNCQTERP